MSSRKASPTHACIQGLICCAVLQAAGHCPLLTPGHDHRLQTQHHNRGADAAQWRLSCEGIEEKAPALLSHKQGHSTPFDGPGSCILAVEFNGDRQQGQACVRVGREAMTGIGSLEGRLSRWATVLIQVSV